MRSARLMRRQHEDEDEGEEEAVQDLGQEEHRKSGTPRIRMMPAPMHDHARVERVEPGRLRPRLVDAGLEAEPLADRVGRRERQDRTPRRATRSRGRTRRASAAYGPASGFRDARPAPRPSMRIPAGKSVAPQATMMKNATTSVRMQPTMTSQRDELVLLRPDALLDDRRLQVELHPRRDRRADDPDDHEVPRASNSMRGWNVCLRTSVQTGFAKSADTM